MKSIRCAQPLLRQFLLSMAIAAALSVTVAAEAAGVTVTGVLGLAQYSKAGGAYQPVKVGAVLQSGDTLQTATGSALDLDLGPNGGTVRLLQSTTVRLTTVEASQILLDLKGGELLGKPGGKSAGFKFRIEMPSGIAGIVEGEFRLNARGYLVLIEGTAVFVEAPTVGEPAVHTLNGTVYYSPAEHAVRPAPKALVREVRSQFKARLPKK